MEGLSERKFRQIRLMADLRTGSAADSETENMFGSLSSTLFRSNTVFSTLALLPATCRRQARCLGSRITANALRDGTETHL